MSFLAPNPIEARRRNLIIGGAALAATLLIGVGFYVGGDAERLERVPVIIYVDNWAATRTRQDVLDDRARAEALLQKKLAASRAYIATLPPEKRAEAQAQYNAYLNSPKARAD